MARARVFDMDQAINIATELFWKNGYERTSLAELTQAMGITPPSFYFAFGSKDGLFIKVVEHYLKTRMAYAEEALHQLTAREVAETMLYRMAELYTDSAHQPGCMLVNCALPCADNIIPVRQELGLLREARRARLCERLQQAQRCGDLPVDANPEELTRFIMVVGWGMAIDAQAGASRDDLNRTVARTMLAWPN